MHQRRSEPCNNACHHYDVPKPKAVHQRLSKWPMKVLDARFAGVVATVLNCFVSAFNVIEEEVVQLGISVA